MSTVTTTYFIYDTETEIFSYNNPKNFDTAITAYQSMCSYRRSTLQREITEDDPIKIFLPKAGQYSSETTLKVAGFSRVLPQTYVHLILDDPTVEAVLPNSSSSIYYRTSYSTGDNPYVVELTILKPGTQISTDKKYPLQYYPINLNYLSSLKKITVSEYVDFKGNATLQEMSIGSNVTFTGDITVGNASIGSNVTFTGDITVGNASIGSDVTVSGKAAIDNLRLNSNFQNISFGEGSSVDELTIGENPWDIFDKSFSLDFGDVSVQHVTINGTTQGTSITIPGKYSSETSRIQVNTYGITLIGDNTIVENTYTRSSYNTKKGYVDISVLSASNRAEFLGKPQYIYALEFYDININCEIDKNYADDVRYRFGKSASIVKIESNQHELKEPILIGDATLSYPWTIEHLELIFKHLSEVTTDFIKPSSLPTYGGNLFIKDMIVNLEDFTKVSPTYSNYRGTASDYIYCSVANYSVIAPFCWISSIETLTFLGSTLEYIGHTNLSGKNDGYIHWLSRGFYYTRNEAYYIGSNKKNANIQVSKVVCENLAVEGVLLKGTAEHEESLGSSYYAFFGDNSYFDIIYNEGDTRSFNPSDSRLEYVMRYKNFSRTGRDEKTFDIGPVNYSSTKTQLSNFLKISNSSILATGVGLIINIEKGYTYDNIDYLFEGNKQIYRVNINSDKIISAKNAFEGSSISYFNTYAEHYLPNLTDASYMFSECKNLKGCGVGYIGNLVKADYMFYYAGSSSTNIRFFGPGYTSYTINLPKTLKAAGHMFSGSKGIEAVEFAPDTEIYVPEGEGVDFQPLYPEAFYQVFMNSSVSQVTLPLVTNVYGCNDLFRGCTKLTTVYNANFPKCDSTQHMFANCSLLTTIDGLNIPNASDARYMFYECRNLENYDIDGVVHIGDGDQLVFDAIYADYMFFNCYKVKLLPYRYLTRTFSLNYTFYKCITLTDEDVAKIYSPCWSANHAFANCNFENIDLGHFPSLQDARNMFDNSNIKNVAVGEIYSPHLDRYFDNLEIRITENMFVGCQNLATVDVNKMIHVTTADSMFKSSSIKTLDIDNPDVFSLVTSAAGMFSDSTIEHINKWNFPQSEDYSLFADMFKNCTHLKDTGSFRVESLKQEADVGTWLKNLEEAYPGSVYGGKTAVEGYVYYDGESRALPVSSMDKWLAYKPENDADNVYEIYITDMVQNNCNGNETPELNPDSVQYILSKNPTKLVSINLNPSSFIDNEDGRYYNCENMFLNCDNLKSVSADLCFVGNCNYMFKNCDGLENTIIYNLNNMRDVNGKCTAKGTFMNCSNLKVLNLNKTDENQDSYPHNVSLSSVEDATELFSGCDSLITVDNIGLMTNVKNATRMFKGCNSIPIQELSEFNSVQNATEMFAGCASIVQIDPNAFGNVRIADGMFQNCVNLVSASNLKLFTGYEKNMMARAVVRAIDSADFMFSGCKNLETVGIYYIDSETGNKIVPRISNAGYMFEGCIKLEEIDFSPFNTIESGLNTSGGITGRGAWGMFKNCVGLKTVDNFGIDTQFVDDSMMFEGCSGLTNVYFIDTRNPKIGIKGTDSKLEWLVYDIKLGNTETDEKGDKKTYAEINVYQLDESSSAFTLKEVTPAEGLQQPYKAYYGNEKVLVMGGYIDELIFAPPESGLEYKHIETMMCSKVPITDSSKTGREVLDPTAANMVLWAKNQSTFITNLVFPDGFSAECDTDGDERVKDITITNWYGDSLPFRYDLDVTFKNENTYSGADMQLRLFNNNGDVLDIIPVRSSRGAEAAVSIGENDVITFRVIKGVARLLNDGAGGGAVKADWVGTQEEYDELKELGKIDPNKTYFVEDGIPEDFRIIDDETATDATTYSSELIESKLTDVRNSIPVNWSEGHVKTNEVFFDGKPIYRTCKHFAKNGLVIYDNKWVTVMNASGNIDYLVRLFVAIKTDASSTYGITDFLTFGSANPTSRQLVQNGEIKLAYASSSSDHSYTFPYECVLVAEYTVR